MKGAWGLGKKFEKEYEVHYYEVNYRLECKIATIINYFCDLGTKQSEELGVGIEYLTKRNLAWVFYKYDIKFKRYPKYGEKIKVVTIPAAFRKFYASRLYEIYDSEGEKIVEAEGIFLLIDINKRKAVRIPEDQYSVYGVNTDENNITINKIEKLREEMFSETFKVRYSDIDSNKHVNNVKYVEWAIESVPLDIVLNYELNSLEIVFQKECSYGIEVNAICEVIEEEDGLKILHKIEDESKTELTALVSKWIKIS